MENLKISSEMEVKLNMRASDIVGNLDCPEKASRYLCFEDNLRYQTERDIIKDILLSMKDGKDFDTIIDMIHNSIENKLASVLVYDTTYEKQRVLAFEKKLLNRLAAYLYNNVAKVLELNVNTSYVYGVSTISSRVDMIYEDHAGITNALVLSLGKASRSNRGRSLTTSIKYDLGILISKLYLELQYPNIVINKIYLRSKEENANSILPTDMSVGLTTKDHVHIYDFLGKPFLTFQENGELSIASFDEKIAEIMDAKPSHNCSSCNNKAFCQAETLEDAIKELPTAEKEVTFSVDGLSEEQKKIALQKDGNMVVCSGPGAGKTKTLVSRAIFLMSRNYYRVPFGNILLLAFEKKAVEEIRQRLEVVGIAKDMMPTICTIDSLCYQILSDNSKILGFVPAILNNGKRLAIIRKSCDIIRHSDSGELLPPVRGLSSLFDGPTGLISSLSEMFDFMEKSPNKDILSVRYPNVNIDDFLEIYERYCLLKDEGHFMTYEEINVLCNNFLRSNKDILNAYQSMFRYIMADEYQDMNKAQHELITMLWGEKNSLFVFGDDDQALFSWRGGDISYMLSLASRNDFSTAMLTTNYRSEKNIIEASEKVIDSIRNFDKKMKTQKGVGVPIKSINYDNSNQLDKEIESLLKEGYSYGDIAVIAYKNNILSDLKGEVAHIPSVLSKRYLYNTCLVQVLYNAIKVAFETNESSCAYLIRLIIGKDEIDELSTYKNLGSLISYVYTNEKYQLIMNVIDFVKDASNFDNYISFIKRFSELLGLEKSFEKSSLIDTLKQDLAEDASYDDFVYAIENLVKNDRDTHVDVEQKNRVMFITQHSSKGLEWPAVIYFDTAAKNAEKKELTDEQKRTLYVTITRAISRFTIIGDSSGFFDYTE